MTSMACRDATIGRRERNFANSRFLRHRRVFLVRVGPIDEDEGDVDPAVEEARDGQREVHAFHAAHLVEAVNQKDVGRAVERSSDRSRPNPPRGGGNEEPVAVVGGLESERLRGGRGHGWAALAAAAAVGRAARVHQECARLAGRGRGGAGGGRRWRWPRRQ